MSQLQVLSTCPNCGQSISSIIDVSGGGDDTPKVRANIQPTGNVLVYKITSGMIKDFVIQKARQYAPAVRMEIVPRFCEKKRRHAGEPHRAYASFRIAFSEDVLNRKDDLGWYGKIGESVDNIQFIPSIFQNLIQKYRYDPKVVDEWLGSYKNLEELEDALGMNEAYIADIRQYTHPRGVKSDNGMWVIFAAAAENIIRDMLTDPATNKVPGRIQINDVYQIDKDVVEFIIYLHTTEVETHENVHVRQILQGKVKK